MEVGNKAQEKHKTVEVALTLLLAHSSCATAAPGSSTGTNTRKLAERARDSPAQLTRPELTRAGEADPQTLLIRPKAFQLPANLSGEEGKKQGCYLCVLFSRLMLLFLTVLAEDIEPLATPSSPGVHSRYKTPWLFSRGVQKWI